MKTKYKYIKFEPGVGTATEAWICCNTKDNYRLGWVEWYPRWKCWQFCPAGDTAFTTDCLADIIHFIGQLKKEQDNGKEENVAAKIRQD